MPTRILLELITRTLNLNSSAISASSTFNSWIKSECLGSVPTFFFRNTTSCSECCLCCCCCFISTFWGKGNSDFGWLVDGITNLCNVVFFAFFPQKIWKGVLLAVFCHFSKCCLSSCLHIEKYFMWLQLGAGISCFSSEMISETGK